MVLRAEVLGVREVAAGRVAAKVAGRPEVTSALVGDLAPNALVRNMNKNLLRFAALLVSLRADDASVLALR